MCAKAENAPNATTLFLILFGMHNLYLGLGSNVGNRKELLSEALNRIEQRIGKVTRLSSFIETEPWGFQSKNRFINAACLVETILTPLECLEETQQIERELGRTHKTINGEYHDRCIDIDLLKYDNLQMRTDRLTLPHPLIQERDFVRIPLSEIE